MGQILDLLKQRASVRKFENRSVPGPVVARLLNLSQGTLPAEILALGYPALGQKAAPKKRLEELVIRFE